MHGAGADSDEADRSPEKFCWRARLAFDLAPAPGRYDRMRVEQVVGNLLVNAGKFGEGKPVVLRVRPDGEFAVLEVSDQGIGIPPDVDVRKTTSLGLKLIRNLVLQLGGSVTITSRNGTEVAVEFPLHPKGG